MTLLTQREAASLLRLSERTLERLRVFGLGPKFARCSRSIRYRLADLDEWIASRVVGSTSEKLQAVAMPEPRLRWDLSDVGLRNFLIDPERIGVVCTKYRNSVGNGWSFPPLSECREAWERVYGPQRWDNLALREWRLPL